MRKLLLLFAVMLSAVGAWAQTQEVVRYYKPTNRVSELKTDGTMYMIFNAVNYPGMYGARYGFVSNNGSGLNKPIVKPSEMQALTTAHLFTLEASGTDNVYYIKSVSNEKYVNPSGKTDNAEAQDCYIYKWTETPVTKGGFTSVMSKDDESVMLPTADITDAECLFTISNNNGSTCWNGNEGSFTTWSDAHPYAFYEVQEVEESVTTTAITELANVSNNKLYIIKNALKSNTALVYKNGGANVVWNGRDTSVDYDPRSNNFRWAIYKSTNSKYYLYNIGAGKYMGSALAGNAAIPFVDASGLHSVVIEKSSDNADFPFMMSTNNKKGALNTNPNLQQGVLNWHDGYSKTTDKGNQFAFYEVADIPQDVLTAIEAAVTDYEANGVSNWKNTHAASGYVGHYPLSTQDAYNAIASEVDIDNFMYANNVVALVDGYYFVKGTGTGNRDTWYLSHKVENGKECVWAVAPTGNLNADYIWKFETADGGYKIQSANVGKYFQLKTATNNGDNNTYIENDLAGGDKFVVENKGMGKHLIKNANGENIRTENGDASGAQVNYWNGEKTESWYLIPATGMEIATSITDAGAATLYTSVPLNIPEGVTAKYVKAVDNEGSTGKLRYTKLDKTIPANTAVVLTGEKGDYAFTVANDVEAVTDNVLFGYATETAATDNTGIYALANKTNGVAFYPFVGTTYKAGKAYLNTSGLSASEVRFFNIFDEDMETAIEGVEAVDTKSEIYDLAGRRVQNAQKGVFIVNGKVVIK